MPRVVDQIRQAEERDTGMGRLRVISAEGLIGFKLQAYVNDAARTRDLDDIQPLLRSNRAALDMGQVRGYFALFDREPLLDDILADLDR